MQIFELESIYLHLFSPFSFVILFGTKSADQHLNKAKALYSLQKLCEQTSDMKAIQTERVDNKIEIDSFTSNSKK